MQINGKIVSPTSGTKKVVLHLIVNDEVYQELDFLLFSYLENTLFTFESFDEFIAWFQKIEYTRAYNFAVRSLAKRGVHSKQLKKKLKKKRISEATQERIIQECLKLGFLSDDNWVKNEVKRLQAKGKSRRHILFHLKSQHVDNEELVDLFEEDGSQEDEVLQRLIRKRYPALLAKKTDPKTYQKGFLALLRRGFLAEDIKRQITALQGFES